MITFTRTTTDSYNAATDTRTTSTSTVTGEVVQIIPKQSDIARFNELELRFTETVLLLFVPTTYGQLPRPGDEVTWPSGGDVYTVRDVNELAPDGVTILAKVACSR